MTEEQIERRVEAMIDHLDHAFLSGALTQKQYDSNMHDIDVWAESKYREIAVQQRAKSIEAR